MKVLWAPWRMEYILSNKKDEACIFCPGDDRRLDEERLILHVGSLTMVVMNKYPYNNGHLLVAPIQHVSDMDGLSNEESLDLLLMLRRSISILKKSMNPEKPSNINSLRCETGPSGLGIIMRVRAIAAVTKAISTGTSGMATLSAGPISRFLSGDVMD